MLQGFSCIQNIIFLPAICPLVHRLTAPCNVIILIPSFGLKRDSGECVIMSLEGHMIVKFVLKKFNALGMKFLIGENACIEGL